MVIADRNIIVCCKVLRGFIKNAFAVSTFLLVNIPILNVTDRYVSGVQW
jgi:hypothetical protein